MTEEAEVARRTRVATIASSYSLTRRQAEVLMYVSVGFSNKEVAAALGTAEVTVEAHMTRMMRKLGVESRGQLISRFWSSF